MATTLMRTALQPLYREANEAHPGLLIQRGLALYDQDSDEGRQAKTNHLRRICAIPASDFYQHAYARWEAATANPARFRQVRLELLARLFIGLTAGGMLETGCAISHSYGTPYVPGSSLKGVVRGHIRGSTFARTNPGVIAELFGVDANPDSPYPGGLSGLVNFHDAWWVPGSAPTPLVEEIVTTHHLEYYGQEGAVPASDADSPIPNAQLAVRGRFLFVLEGPPAWLELAEKMLLSALANQGIGAKTRTGYGLFDPVPKVPARPTCAWVDTTIASLAQKNRASELDTLRGKALAEAWSALTDPALKTEALAEIQARWQEKQWWDDPPSKSASKVKAIYTADG